MYSIIYFLQFSFYVLLIRCSLIRKSDDFFKENFLEMLGIQNASNMELEENVWSSQYLESLYNALTSLPSEIFKSDVTVYGYQPVNTTIASDSSIIQDFDVNIARHHSFDSSRDGQVEVIIETEVPMIESTISITICWKQICTFNISKEITTEAHVYILDITAIFSTLKEKIMLVQVTPILESKTKETISLNFNFIRPKHAEIMLQSKFILVFHSVAKVKYQKLLKYSTSHSRQRRAAISDSEIPLKVQLESNPCSRKAWEVDFEELGWSDWIVQPKTFEAYACSGTCKTDDLKNNVTMSRHAFVRQIYIERSENPLIRNSVPEATCVPIETEALHTLFLDKGNLVLKRIDEIIAKTCGCL